MATTLKPDTIRKGFRRWFVGTESADGEQRMYCPICEDPETSRSPSGMMNPGTGVWNCLKNDHGGTVVSLVKQLKERDGFDIRTEAMAGNSRAARGEGKPSGRKGEPPSGAAVAMWHEALLDTNGVLESFIDARCISEETIEEYEIGWDSNARRYTIPIYDVDGELVNVRKYKMGASDGDQKFWNLPGYGDARLFLPDVLRTTDWVVLAEGELDTLVLSQEGFPAVSGTGGSGVFKPEWAEGFTDKTVYVAYDADDAGEKGAVKVANALRNFASAVYRVRLPEPGTDVTDFFAAGGTGDEFEELINQANKSGPRISKVISDTPKSGMRLSLLESMSDKAQGEPIELVVSVTGKQQEPFTAPRRVIAACDMSKGAPCEVCPLMARNGEMEIVTQPHDTRLMEFVDVSSTAQHRLLRMMTGARCADRVQFEVPELWRVEELAVQASVDERVDEAEDRPTRRTVWSVGTYATNTNEKVRLIGTNVPDPKSGVLKFHSWQNNKVDLDIDKFALTPDIREQLQVFRPEDGQTALDKCLDIAGDMSRNVTMIIGRDLLHVGMDLVFHSPIAFRVNGQDVDKGWLEMMVIGDTRTGKSEIASRLMAHYASGRMISCEGVTFAGLIGGVQQINNRWHMTWGIIPMQDRRLVILDEVSGMGEQNIIERMSSVRSGGVAQITKIQTESTSARTRLIWISNPQNGMFLAENRQGGVGALQTVVRNKEDVARFDFVMAAASGDVSPTEINRTHQPGPPGHDTESCELLVKWTWSLGRDSVRISSGAVSSASRAAVALGERYSPFPPLIQAANARFKILRIAAAIAARTFSADNSGHLHVTRDHVRDAVQFLDLAYGQDSLGYGRISDEERGRRVLSQDKQSVTEQMLRANEAIYETLAMNDSGVFRVRDFTDFQGMESGEASRVLAQLHRWGMVKYANRGEFTMTPQLISLLRRIKEED